MVGFTYILSSSKLPCVVPILIHHATRLLPEVHSWEIAPPVKHISIFIKIPTCTKVQEKRKVLSERMLEQPFFQYVRAALPPLFPPFI